MAQEQKPMCVGSPDHCPQVQQTAEDAARKVFAILGANIDAQKNSDLF